MAYGTKPSRFLLPFFLAVLFFMLVLAYQAMKQKIVISKRTNCIIGLGLLLSVVYLYFHQYSFISKTQPQAISRFLSKFSILGVLGIATVTCFIFYAYWENLRRANWKNDSNGSSSGHLSVGCSLVKDRLSLVASGDYSDALLEHSLYPKL